MKANLKRVEELLDTWSASSLFSRYNKASTVKDFEQLQKQVRSQRYHVIKEGGSEIHKLLKDTNKKLKVSQGLPDWKAYVDFINNIVVGGLVQVIIVSLEILEQQIDPINIVRQNLAPMIEIELDLFGGHVHFLPEVGFVSTSDVDKQGIRNIVQGWIDSFVAVSAVFKRLDSGEGNYLKEMQDDPFVQMLLASINSLLGDMEKKGNDYRKNYEKYSYLWSTDLNEMFQAFLEDAVVAESPVGGAEAGEAGEDGEEKADGKGDDADEEGAEVATTLDLVKFDKKIREYLEVQSEIADLKPVHDMDFLRINAQPIKQALGTWVTKWMYLYTQHLQTHISGKLQDVAAFIKQVNSGLDIKPDNQSSLMTVMTHIRDVRKRMAYMEHTFQPLRDMVMLLKTHGISMDLGMVGEMQALDFLEAAPLEWDNTVNKTFRVKEEIQPLQNAMVETIKNDITQFSGRMEAFVKEFHANGPFKWSPDEGDNVHSVYAKIDESQQKLVKMETEAQAFTELEELFELTSSRHTRLKDMRLELGLLKMVWDTICLVQFLFSSWKSTLWADIDTEVLLDETKMLQTQIKKLPRRVRDWDVYQNLEAEVRNMATVLPLVHELHSPAMRDRHWKALITVTRKSFEKGPSFALEDLLALELHLYVEGVMEIVETANKELKVESKLKVIEDCWSAMSLEFDRHRDTEVFVLVASDELLETLEDHQMQLQVGGCAVCRVPCAVCRVPCAVWRVACGVFNRAPGFPALPLPRHPRHHPRHRPHRRPRRRPHHRPRHSATPSRWWAWAASSTSSARA